MATRRQRVRSPFARGGYAEPAVEPVYEVPAVGSVGTGQIAGAAVQTGNIGAGAVNHATQVSNVLPDQHHAQLHATTHQPGGNDAMAVDAVPATGSLRTLGVGAQQAAVGSHTHVDTDPAASFLSIAKWGTD